MFSASPVLTLSPPRQHPADAATAHRESAEIGEVTVLSDRTTNIRASVDDTQFS